MRLSRRIPAKKKGPTRPTTRGPAGNNQVRKNVKRHGPLIVGIGASAGGLQAFTQLLRHLPRDPGMALVLVQHLAPKHASALTELLGRTTAMPVTEVKEGMAVEANCVYVIPPDHDMGVGRGKLHLAPRFKARPPMPIDYFFRSLAEDQGNKAIGVIFSGTASDGTLGLQAIKAAGGITFAQNPESAEHGDMPRNAIAAGCVDVVLPIEDIAKELLRLSQHPYLQEPKAAEAKDLEGKEEDKLRRIYAILRTTAGVDFTHYKVTTVLWRIRRRMMLLRVESLTAYAQYLQDHRGEVQALFQDILIHVTEFFRDPEVFSELKTTVFPNLLKGRPSGESLRFWVPGCSTGEEVYSLAMALFEFLSDSASSTRIQIFATDVDEAALERSRQGIYLESTVGAVSSERLRRFFIKTPHGYQINKSIREACVFARHDVSKDPPFSHLDLISCRNLLIYLGSVLQKRILPVFHYALKPSGYLLLGSSETIGSFAEYFSLQDKKHKIYIRKDNHRPPPVSFDSSLYSRTGLPGYSANYDATATLNNRADFDVQKAAERFLLERYTPPGVIVNKDLQILNFRGRVGRYLEPASGEASLNLGKMAREELVLDLRAAVHEAGKRDRAIQKQGLQVRRNGKTVEVVIEAIPIKAPASADQYFLVLFRETAPTSEGDRRKATRGRSVQSDASQTVARQVTQLKDELARSKGTLRSAIEELEATNEELRSANEEILSSNEELQSTNEELETAKEELQSTNEELTTLNEELQNRNQDLSMANNDILNFLGSVNIPMLMLDNSLRIRRFTPGARRVLNVVQSDIGRPIGDIKLGFESQDFDRLISEAIDNVIVKVQEVQAREGAWYSMRIRPYKTSENKIDGAVITWVEVTAMKSALDESTQRYDFVFNRNLAGVFYARVGELIDCNDAFAQILGYSSREEALQESDWSRHLALADQKSYYNALLKKELLANVLVRVTHRDGTPRWVLANFGLKPHSGGDSGPSEVVEGIIVDITRQVEAEERLGKLAVELMRDADDRRRKLARELHDMTGANMTGLIANLAVLARHTRLDDKLRQRVSECQTLARECINQIRKVSYLQHPLVIEEMGLGPAVKWYAKEFSKVSGVKVKVDIPHPLGRISEDLKIALYRIIQECLTNIRNHAQAKSAGIQVIRNAKGLTVKVQDSGKGFDTAREGMGIIGMRERLKEFGGRLEIESGKKGTTVRATLPLASLKG